MRGTTDVGTTGDGGNGLPQGPSNGLDVMGSVLGGAAGAYGDDVLNTARGILLLTVFPPGYFALQGYRFWGSVIGGAMDGYAQDGVLGAVAGAINSVNPFAHVGISLASTVDAAEKGDYKKAGEQGYQALKGIAGIAATAIGAGIGRGGPPASGATQGALLRATLAAEEVAGARLPKSITGYSRHGLNQAISRDGVGVSTRAILDTFKNPTNITGQSGGRFLMTGRDAVIVVNAEGQVVTTWATSIQGIRVIP